MQAGDVILAWIDAAAHETMLFAAMGFLIGGIDDLAVDLLYLGRRLVRGTTTPALADLGDPPRLRFAILVPAWDESGVIGAMLRTTLARLDRADLRVLVGCYPNDAATIAAVAAVAAEDARVLPVIGPRAGPTTKADCLNALWQALLRDDARRGVATDAVLLHDAEDVVHPDELVVLEAGLIDHAAVQLPVLPLVQRGSRFVAGHYSDEFAYAHGVQLVVRTALGAGLPFAGVGCAIRCTALVDVALAHDAPFDARSLVEDYELGLRLAALGHATRFARVRAADGSLVAVREYFPATIGAAVRQKARWMTGIALAGWDRLGWGRMFDLGEHWMRMRDRRAPLAVIVLAVGYLALVLWASSTALHAIAGTAPAPPPPWLRTLLAIDLALLGWRLVLRSALTAHEYGWREGMLAVPRAFVGNVVALLAARRAVVRYLSILTGGEPRWDKTRHMFPSVEEARP